MNYDVVEVVVNKLVSTFKLREWTYDLESLVEDIAEALKLIGAAKVFAEILQPVEVNGMMAKIPRDCQNIKYVDTPNQPYRESGNFIEIDKPDGTMVNIVYQGLPVDVRGYPLVPDTAPVREAIMWYLVKILTLQREIKHINYQMAESEWQWRCGSARADLNALNVQQVNQMYQNFVRLNPIKDAHQNNYEALGRGNTLNRDKRANTINNREI